MSSSRNLVLSIGIALFAGVVLAAPLAADETIVDDQGRLIQSIADDGSTIDYRYDEEGRVIQEERSDGTLVQYWYDEDGIRHVVGEE